MREKPQDAEINALKGGDIFEVILANARITSPPDFQGRKPTARDLLVAVLHWKSQCAGWTHVWQGGHIVPNGLKMKEGQGKVPEKGSSA